MRSRGGAVVDSSVVVRWLIENSTEAADAIRQGPLAAPSVIVPETTNALVKEVRFAGLDPVTARLLLENFLALPVDLVADAHLAEDALVLGSEIGLSAYDASYVVLAARRRVPLLTADRRVAAIYELGELIG